MKYLFLVVLLLTLLCCHRSSDENANPIDQLPPATQTGANTAGCLVNGKVLLPRGQKIQNGPVIVAQYQYLNSGYHFSLGIQDNSGTNLKSIGIGSDNVTLEQGKIYIISENLYNNSLINTYAHYTDYAINFYQTTNNNTGQITINKLDKVNYIISGTFWFNAVDSNGGIVKVTDGRFDVHYAP